MDLALLLAETPTIQNGQWLGAVTNSGAALCATTALIMGVRGSDRIKLNSRDKAGGFAFVTGSLWLAAGTTWADAASGIHSVPTSVLGQGSLGDPGAGGAAVFLLLCTFGPKWKRAVWPALLGIASAVACQQAGGLGGIAVNAVRMITFKITGGH